MNVEFANAKLSRLDTDPGYTMGLDQPIVRAYRKLLNGIRSAADERDLRAMKSWRLEKLRGRAGEHSMRLNKQYRLIVEFSGDAPDKVVRVLGVEDYH